MKVFIVEDERLGLERLVKMLRETEPGIEVLGHAETVKSAVWWLQNNPAPDLLFLDIELADGQCFEIFKQVEVQTPVIFTTSYDEYALHAFKVNSVDYLLKPVRQEDLKQSLDKFRRLQQHFGHNNMQERLENLLSGLQDPGNRPREYRKRFLVRQGQRLLSVETSDIAWFMADGKLCFLRTWNNQRYLLDYTLEELENMLDPSEFYRANRSYIVHARAVSSIHPYFNGKLLLQLQPPSDNNDTVISKEKASDFKKWMGK